MAAFLEEMVAAARARVAEAQAHIPLAELASRAGRMAQPPRRFRASLEAAAEHGFAVIAELKKASPSKGVLRGTYPVGGLALQYAQGGAAALSVLTEESRFAGSLTHLLEAHAATELPCLRKDFLVDEYQIHESRLHGADAVLLIAAALSDADYKSLYETARSLGLDVVCEVHDRADLERTLALGAEVIGVNCRDLRTLEIDPATFEHLAPHLPATALRVAESGIRNGADLRRLRSLGYQAFLIGEAFMTADEPGNALARLIAEAKAPPLGSAGVGGFGTGTKD